MATIITKTVHADTLLRTLEDLNAMLLRQYPEDEQSRTIALSYILYRGMDAMREEWQQIQGDEEEADRKFFEDLAWFRTLLSR